MSNSTGRTELPPIESDVSVRLLEGVIVTGVVTGHGQKDGKPTFDFEYDHRTPEGQILKASKWAWPEQVQRNLSNFIEQSAETTAFEQAIQAHHRRACEHKIALHVDAAIDVVDTDPEEADAWAYEAGKEAWEFDLPAPEKLASYPTLSAAFRRGFDSVEQARSQRELSNYIGQPSKAQIDLDDVAEWVGLHYGRNFEREPQEKRKEWVERYAEAHGLPQPLNSTGQSDAKRVISATSAELALIRAAVENYRELVSSPTSADRSANGDDWADREVQACDALLQSKLQLILSQSLETAEGPQDFTVRFEVSITASSPEEAAGLALDDLRDTSIGPWSAEVVDSLGGLREVSAEQADPRDNYPTPGM